MLRSGYALEHDPLSRQTCFSMTTDLSETRIALALEQALERHGFEAHCIVDNSFFREESQQIIKLYLLF